MHRNLTYIFLRIFIAVILKKIDDTPIKTDSILKGFIMEKVVLIYYLAISNYIKN